MPTSIAQTRRSSNPPPGRRRSSSPVDHLPTTVYLFLLLLPLAGCSGPKKVEIAGTVTLDSKPIENGLIRFLPADGAGPSAETVIADGQYKLPMTLGKKKVSITMEKKIGERHIGHPDGPLADITEQVIPKRYSDPNETELTREVTGSATLDFALESDKKPGSH